MEVITSLDNKKIKNYAKLLQKKYRDLSDVYLAEGEHLVEEALEENMLVEVIVTPDYEKTYDVLTTVVTYEVLKKLVTSKSPQRIVGIVRKKKEEQISGKVLLLDDISDPGNLGTIIRSSVAFGVNTIVLSEGSVDLYNEKVLRATEGMIYKVNIVRRELSSVIDELKSDGYLVIGTKVTDGDNVKNIDKNNKIALVMGNEGQGVSKKILDKCDKYIYINMNSNCESLNVGVATSIILYELY